MLQQRREVRPPSRIEIIHTEHFMPCGDEFGAQVRPQEACPTCDEYSPTQEVCHSPSFTPLASHPLKEALAQAILHYGHGASPDAHRVRVGGSAVAQLDSMATRGHGKLHVAIWKVLRPPQ